MTRQNDGGSIIDDEGITCPHCGKLHTDEIDDFVDFWSQDTQPFICERCDEEFNVSVIVERRWKSTRIEHK